MEQIRRRQMADRFMQERLNQPQRSSEEAYAQMERMKTPRKEKSQDTNGASLAAGRKTEA